MRFNFSGPFKFDRLQEVDDKMSEFNNDACDAFTMVVDLDEEDEGGFRARRGPEAPAHLSF